LIRASPESRCRPRRQLGRTPGEDPAVHRATRLGRQPVEDRTPEFAKFLPHSFRLPTPGRHASWATSDGRDLLDPRSAADGLI
jgi:hypothetical protein